MILLNLTRSETFSLIINLVYRPGGMNHKSRSIVPLAGSPPKFPLSTWTSLTV